VFRKGRSAHTPLKTRAGEKRVMENDEEGFITSFFSSFWLPYHMHLQFDPKISGWDLEIRAGDSFHDLIKLLRQLKNP